MQGVKRVQGLAESGMELLYHELSLQREIKRGGAGGWGKTKHP